MLLKVFVVTKLLVIQVTFAQFWTHNQNGVQNEQLPLNRRCSRQANPQDSLAISENNFNNGMPVNNLPCNENEFASIAANNIKRNVNLPINMARNLNNAIGRMLPNNALQFNNIPPGNGLQNLNIPVNNGILNTNNLPFNGNGLSIGGNMMPGNSLPIGNNLPINNLVPNYNNGQFINGIPNLNNNPNNGFLNNLPSANALPNFNNVPVNGMPNFQQPISGLLNVPGSFNLPINNMLNGNNMPVMPNAYNVLPNGFANLPQNTLPIPNGLPNALNFPLANVMPNMNYLPNTNLLNNLPISDGGPNINNFAIPNTMASTNLFLNNLLQSTGNSIPVNNLAFSGLELSNNNPFTIASNMPLHTIMPNINNLPINAMSSSVSFLNSGVNNGGIGLPFNNLPLSNNLPSNQNIIQNGLSYPANLLQSQPGLGNNLPNSLQIEGFGNLPLLNGLPVTGITETVTVLNNPCPCN